MNNASINPNLGCVETGLMGDSRALAKDTALNVVVCGVGGQGNVLASRLIADMFLARGAEVKTAETIGMAQRGGSVASHVRVGEAASPLVPQGCADVLVAFEPGEAVRCIGFVRAGAVVVCNTAAVQPPTAALTGANYDGSEALAYLQELSAAGHVQLVEVDGPAVTAAVGNPKTLNIVLLAAATRAGALGTTRAELEAAVQARVKPRFHALNLAAIAAVFEE